MLITAVVPVRTPNLGDEAMRGVARRFGMDGLVTLGVLLDTDAAMASRCRGRAADRERLKQAAEHLLTSEGWQRWLRLPSRADWRG